MLGRGLESLIPPQDESKSGSHISANTEPIFRTAANIESVSGPVFQIETKDIKPNPHQPRKVFGEAALKELAASIAEFGIMQPLVASKVEFDTPSGRNVEYQLIAGERRLMAAKMIGLPRVPVVIKMVSEEREKLELAIIENLQRENLNPIEAARAYAKLQDQFGITQREIAVRLAKSREVIGNAMRLLSLPTVIQDALSRGALSESQGRLLLTVDDPMTQQVLFNDIVQNNLSVRELKNRIAHMRGGGGGVSTTGSTPLDPELRSAEVKLQEFFGTKVRLATQGKSGKITIDFYSPEELRGIIEKLIEHREPSPTPLHTDDGGFSI